MIKLTTEEWIEKAQKIHGNKYDYSRVQYINAKTKVTIICPMHGEFLQRPDKHQQGRGCPKCALEYKSNLFKSNTTEFIEKARKIHGSKYDYSKVEYNKVSKKVEIICPIHGSFWQTPKGHLDGNGCIKCAHDKMHNARTKDVNIFIKEANIVHNNKYDYSKVEYYNAHKEVCIICPQHGEFWQTPHSHLNKKSGCPICSQSKGEKQICKYLLNNNINYISQYKIDIDKSINPTGKAYIDFYLTDLNIAIEYNGIQHYIPIEYFGGKLKFERQLQRDNYIRNYCKNNNIKLIEIKYTENVENILQKYIYPEQKI